jgi:hypothetical protein
MSTQPMSKVPLFGRAYSLIVDLPAAASGGAQTVEVTNSAWEPEALRIVFEVSLTGYSSHSSLWYAKIDIYNTSPELAQSLITGQGATVTLSAGYQTGTGQYNVIFEGEVYQVMFERVGVVDAKITLMCYTGLAETIANLATVRGDAQMTQVALIQRICAAANTPIPIASIDTTALSQTTLPRARPFFGNPHKFVDEVAAGNNMQSWYGFDGLAVSTMNTLPTVAANQKVYADAVENDGLTTSLALTPDIIYDATSGQVIGTPQQTQDGLSMSVLLDPRLRVFAPPQVIQLTNSQIRQLGYYPSGYRPYLDPSGFYQVNGVQHNGDTWGGGDEWRSEIVALTSIGGKAAYVIQATTPAVTLDRRAPR